MNWHNLKAQEIIKNLSSDKILGLTEKECQKRLSKFGKNRLKSEKRNGRTVPPFLFQGVYEKTSKCMNHYLSNKSI